MRPDDRRSSVPAAARRAPITLILLVLGITIAATASLLTIDAEATTRLPPTAPTNVVAGPLEEYAWVTWTPSAPIGTPVTGYRVTAVPGGAVVVVGPGTTEAEFFGLTNGIAYQFFVVALSAHGDSPPSVPSAPVRPTVCAPPRGAGPFLDIPDDHLFCDEIEWMAGAEITTGFTDDTFRPGLTLTRQAISAFLFRALEDLVYLPPIIPSFSDVPPGHPFYKPIEWMSAKGITTGFPDGTFRPLDPISRQSMAAFLYRAAGSPTVLLPIIPTFSDVPAGHPFRTEIEWMVAAGVGQGYPDGTFRPTETVTRGQASAFLFRFVEG